MRLPKILDVEMHWDLAGKREGTGPLSLPACPWIHSPRLNNTTQTQDEPLASTLETGATTSSTNMTALLHWHQVKLYYGILSDTPLEQFEDGTESLIAPRPNIGSPWRRPGCSKGTWPLALASTYANIARRGGACEIWGSSGRARFSHTTLVAPSSIARG